MTVTELEAVSLEGLNQSSLLNAALSYVELGWYILPLKPNDKTPATEHGYKDASNDPQQIASWWGVNPDYNIGLATGPSGLLVVDVDPRSGGDESMQELEAEHGRVLPEALRAVTGGGGYHVFFKRPEGARFRGQLAEGIDLKGDTGYVVLAPSVHPSGDRYQWECEGDVLDCPRWIVERASRPADAPRTVREPDVTDTRPGTLFNLHESFRSILEPHGWTFLEENAGEEFWCRPGKTTGVSATANYEGTNLFYVFTSSTGLEANRAYDKVGLHAALNFDGDVEAALEDIKETWNGPSLTMTIPSTEMNLTSSDDTAYVFESDLPESHIVQRYIRYANLQTDAPSEYHEAAILTLLSCVSRNTRASLAPYPNGLATNLYTVLVGSTTRSRKSTSQSIALDLAKAVVPYAILPGRMTTEALIGMLANKQGQATIWAPDEFGMMVAEIGRREFLRGIEELLLSLYSGQEYVYTKVSDTITVRDPHLNVLGAATPESLALAGPTAMLGGLLPRFGIVFPKSLPDARPAQSIESIADMRSSLIAELREIMQFSDEHKSVTFTPESIAILNVAESELVDRGAHLARLPAMLYKVSMLHAIGRLSAIVTAEDAAAAVTTVNRWRDGAQRLQPFMRRKREDIEFSREMFTALDALKELGGRAHRSQVARRVGIQKSKLDRVQATLEDQGYVKLDRQSGYWEVQ